MLRFTGTLQRAGYARVAPDGTAYVCVELEQHGGKGMPVHAQHRLGAGGAAQQVARIIASQLRAGTRVTAVARRFEVGTKPLPHLHLLDVQHLEYPHLPPRHEPRDHDSTEHAA